MRGAVETWRAPCELKDSPDMTRNSAQRLAQAVAAFGRPRLGACLPVLIALMMLASSPAATQSTPVKGNAALAVSGGFARMLIKLDEDVEADASVAGNILVVRFK
ncbi:MAG: tetratricopeptide 2, partial [Tardiphaga sp.]|nr:tetratricopeptide 2 [Tardiphaga sp.]